MQEELVWGLAIHCHCSLHPVDGDCAEEVGINHVYVNKCMLSRIANSILLKKNTKGVQRCTVSAPKNVL